MWSGVLGSSLQPSEAGCSWVFRAHSSKAGSNGQLRFVSSTPTTSPGPVCQPWGWEVPMCGPPAL